MSARKKTTSHDESIDDIDFEPDAAGDRISKLKQELEACKAERQEYLDGWQRLKADTVNARRELENRQKRATDSAKASILKDFLVAMDSFDMARAGNAWESVDAAWRQGMEGVASQLEAAFAQHGVERFGSVGEPFNPTLHEAIAHVPPSGDIVDGHVAAVVRSGWKMGDSVLRPAQVSVAHQTD